MPITVHFLGRRLVAPLALALFGIAPAANAHPHVWIFLRSEIVFDQAQKLTAIRQTWTFDRAYSSYAILGLDSRPGKQPDPDRLHELAQTNVAALSEWNWYTGLKVKGTKVDFSLPIDASQTCVDGRLTPSFLLPLKTPALVKTIFVETDDPTFYVSFNLADGPGPIRLIHAPSGCTMSVRRPFKAAAEGVQTIADAVAEKHASSKDITSVGSEFIPRILFACP